MRCLIPACRFVPPRSTPIEKLVIDPYQGALLHEVANTRMLLIKALTGLQARAMLECVPNSPECVRRVQGPGPSQRLARDYKRIDATLQT
jgi:hypothetical protein